MRNSDIAHYDFNESESIRLNFNNLSRLNNLYKIAKQIISHYGHSFKKEEMTIGYDFENGSDIDSLKRLLSKAARP